MLDKSSLKLLSLKICYAKKWSGRSYQLVRPKWFDIINLFLIGRNGSLRYSLVLEAVSPLHVRSKVCMAPFYVRSKECKFAPHLEESNADFAPHMEGSHADFAPHMERRHSFRNQQIDKDAVLAHKKNSFFKPPIS